MNADPWGVAYGFSDSSGTWHETPPDTRAQIRAAIGARDDATPAAGALVVDAGVTVDVTVASTLVTEDGAELRLAPGTATPPDLATGYHRLVDERDGSSRALIVTPPSCVPVKDTPTWGWAVQLYGMRSQHSWGFGEFADLAELSRWSKQRGAGMVLVNPLHAPAPIHGQQPSPYFPTSRCYRNPLHLHIEQVPGYRELADRIAASRAAAIALNSDRRIDRDSVFAAKYRALELLWVRWRGAPRSGEHASFDAYVAAEGPSLQSFATYCALTEHHGSNWMEWPRELHRPENPAVVSFAAEHYDRVSFHKWVQWLVDEQLATAAPGLDLMTDLAIGADRAGADAWAWQDSFALTMSVGAPPDDFNTLGQNWGLPPFDPWRLRAGGYEPFIRTVRAAFRHAGALRMDHVMGLFRLFWIPDGATPREGGYVYYPYRDLLGIVALESQRANAYVVGEDLGTIEDYVREELAARKVLSYRLRQFEPGPSQDFPVNALAAVTTHDLPTIPGLWSGSDLAAQESIGVAPNVEGTKAIREQFATWADVDPGAGVEATDEVVKGVYRSLALAPSTILTATLDDALGVEERPNMPGTIDEWPNWRIALPVPLEQILSDPRVGAVADILASRGKQPD